MAILLTAQDVVAALPFSLAVETLEKGFRAFAAGNYAVPQRLMMTTDKGLIAIMPATGKGLICIKTATVRARNAAIRLPTVQATVLLLSEEDGSLLSIIDGTSLTVIRTAAASAVATRQLSNPGPADLGIVGAGPLAVGHVQAIVGVRPLRRVTIYSPHVQQRWRGIMNQLADLEVDVEPARSAREVVENSNLLVLATSSHQPVLDWAWVNPGTHINAVGSHSPTARELDSETVVHGRMICDSVDACWTEAGDLLIPHAAGLIDRNHVSSGLGDILLHRAAGRRAQEEVTIFKSVGLAFQDLCAGFVAWDQAKRLGLGHDWSPNWTGP